MFSRIKSIIPAAIIVLSPTLTSSLLWLSTAEGSTLEAQAPATASAALTWTAPGDDGTTGTATQYDLRYSLSTITEAGWALATQVVGEPAPKPSGGRERMTVPGLVSGTTYYFAMKAVDDAGNWSGLSNVATVVPDGIPPKRITNMSATGGENRGDLALTWTATGDDSTSGTADHYLIAYSSDTITEANWQQASVWGSPPQPLLAGQNQTFVMSGLQPGVEYWVAVKAFDDVGNESPLSNIARGVAKLSIISDIDDESGDVPVGFKLSQNYPNPFNPSTRIDYSLKMAAHVTISIYNIRGQHALTLVDMTALPGKYTAIWDGTDVDGQPVASGIYLYRIRVGAFTQTKKMILMR